jgi:hypothetical protein
MTGKYMERDVITPPAAVSHSVGIPNPYPFIFTADCNSINEYQDENAFLGDILCQFRPYIVRK